ALRGLDGQAPHFLRHPILDADLAGHRMRGHPPRGPGRSASAADPDDPRHGGRRADAARAPGPRVRPLDDPGVAGRLKDGPDPRRSGPPLTLSLAPQLSFEAHRPNVEPCGSASMAKAMFCMSVGGITVLPPRDSARSRYFWRSSTCA